MPVNDCMAVENAVLYCDSNKPYLNCTEVREERKEEEGQKKGEAPRQRGGGWVSLSLSHSHKHTDGQRPSPPINMCTSDHSQLLSAPLLLPSPPPPFPWSPSYSSASASFFSSFSPISVRSLTSAGFELLLLLKLSSTPVFPIGWFNLWTKKVCRWIFDRTAR